MKIYIGRHGQSVGNAAGEIHSNPKLSKLGIQQAKKIAARATKLDFEVIISSDLKRALQTAEIISKKTGKKIVVSSLFREEIHHPEFEGLKNNDHEVERIKKVSFKHRNNPRWHFSKEENFFDLKKSAQKCLRFVEKRKEKSVFIIGHVQMARMLVGVMIFGDKLTSDVYHKIRTGFLMQNSGITVCKIMDGKWKMETWNDQSHLG